MVIGVLLLVASAGPPLEAGESVVPAVRESPFGWIVPERAVGQVEVVLTVPPGHAVYRDRLRVEALEGRIGEVEFPPASLMADPAAPGRWRAAYREDVRIVVPVERTGPAGRLVLALTHQGCREGLCWPEQTRTYTVQVALTVEEGG